MVNLETQSEIQELQSLTTVGRLQYANAEYVTQSDVSGSSGAEIRLSVYRLSGGDPRQALSLVGVSDVTGGTLDKTAVIFDTLQTDGYADQLGDSVGYNFKHILEGATVFRKPGRYMVEYSWSNAGGSTDFGTARIRHYVTVLGVRGA